MALGMTPGRAGADVVIEAAGFLPAFPEGLELVKEDGVFVEVGHFVDVGTISVNPHRHFLRPNLRLEGVWGSRYHHFTRAVAVLQSSDIDFGAVISHVLPLERVREGFDALDGGYELDGQTAFKIVVKGAFRRGCGLREILFVAGSFQVAYAEADPMIAFVPRNGGTRYSLRF